MVVCQFLKMQRRTVPHVLVGPNCINPSPYLKKGAYLFAWRYMMRVMELFVHLLLLQFQFCLFFKSLCHHFGRCHFTRISKDNIFCFLFATKSLWISHKIPLGVCHLAWWQLWNSIVMQVKFNKFLHPNEHPQRIFWYLERPFDWKLSKNRYFLVFSVNFQSLKSTLSS